MAIDSFIRQRQESWDELDGIVEDVYRRGAKRVAPHHLERMIHLYRQVSSDLAHLRTMQADQALVTRLNRLVTRAHGQIYRAAPRRTLSLLRFFLVRYPRIFRETGRMTLASFLLCAIVYAMAYQIVQTQPQVVADILGGMADEFTGPKTAADIRERFFSVDRAGAAPVVASAITANNIRVALLAFGLGVTLGIGTVYVLIVNSAMLGGIAGAFARSGIESELWITVLPHGALELSAIVVAGGAGLTIGWAMWHPGQRTRRLALREEAVKAVQLAVGLVPAFCVAGFIEGFITTREAMPDAVKLTLGITVAAAFWLYLFFGGWGGEGEKRPA